MVIAYIAKVIFTSWVIGHAATLLLKGIIPLSKLSTLNFIGNEKLNKLIGMGLFKWVLVHSFIKYFNRRLQMANRKPNLKELIALKESMFYVETVHLIGFGYVIARVLIHLINDEYHRLILPLLAVNILVNLYPVLLQQVNKRRLDRVIGISRGRQHLRGAAGRSEGCK